MFNLVYLEQKEGWQLEGSVIAIYTNPFFIQWEQGLIISLLKVMEDVSKVQHLEVEDLIGGIKNNKSY